jgi:hypothetical protein
MAVSSSRVAIIGVAAIALIAGSGYCQEKEKEIAFRRIYDGCFKTAAAEPPAPGIDPVAGDGQEMIEAYCDCYAGDAVEALQTGSIDIDTPEGQTRFLDMAQACFAKAH